MAAMNSTPRVGAVDLFWLPVGAGGHVVRWSSSTYEMVSSWLDRRPARRLYHAALEVRLDDDRYVIEMGPAWNEPESERGVVCEGPVGVRPLGRFKAFRYEVRCWRNGHIVEVREAVDSPQRVSEDFLQASDVLDLVRWAPWLTWGRDEIDAHDTWNSNSLISWLLARTGHDMGPIHPPEGGRAPGWSAGLKLALRQRARSPFVPRH
jgi:hypothetical protein